MESPVRASVRRRPRVRPLTHLAPALAASLAIVAGCGSGTEGSTSPTGATGPAAATNERLSIVSDFINDTFPDPAPDYIELSYANAELLMKPRDGEPEPWLAKSVAQRSDTVWRITLNPGITFQDGRRLDAPALKEWMEYDMAHDPAAKGTLGNPSAVKVVDDLSIDVTTPRLFTPFPYALANYTFAVYDAAAVKRVGKRFEKLAGAGIFTGPYRYVRSSAGSVTYDRYDGYWRGRPALAGIDARKISNPEAGLKALANGEADIQLTPAVRLKRAASRYPDLAYLVADVSAGYAGINFNPAKAPFDDPVVRKAVSSAIDSKSISTAVMDGVWRPLAGVFQPTFPLAVEWRTYDPEAAKASLEADGWVAGPDGVRVKSGKRLATEIVTYTDDLQQVGNAVIDMLRAVGFDAKLRRVPEYSPIPGLMAAPGPVNARLLNLESLGLDGNPFATVCRNFEYDKGYNEFVRDGELRDLCRSLLSTTETANRDADFKRLQTLNGERAYYIPIVDEPTTMLVGKRYAHLTVDPYYIFLDWQTSPRG